MTAPTIGVCGFGRCGSTMLMHALDVGGIPPLRGADPVSYECALTDAGQPLEGRAVKLLDQFLYAQLPEAEWRFIWLDRSAADQAASTRKFIKACGWPTPRGFEKKLIRSYLRDRPLALAGLAKFGPVLELSYEDALGEPFSFMGEVADFVGLPFDVKDAARSVHKRSPRCRPDLAFELSGEAP